MTKASAGAVIVVRLETRRLTGKMSSHLLAL